MICPYCQHELDVATLSCLRCGAEYPRQGMPFGIGLRTLAAATAMMLVFSVMLVNCVLDYLPGGPNSTIRSGSPQLASQQLPNLKSSEVGQLLGRWGAGEQESNDPKFLRKH